MPEYQVGERVWALSGEQWWPAKVVVGSLIGIQHTDTETAVRYYSGDPNAADYDVLDDTMLCAYEESSEKAASMDAGLLAAMDACKNDTDALPLRDAPVSSSTAGHKRTREAAQHSAHAHVEGAAASSSKHHRHEKDAAHAHAHAHAHASAAAEGKGHAKIEGYQAALIRAVENKDIVAARRCLLKLAASHITYTVLRDTKIGVTVADLLAIESCRPLYPLARAMVCDWANRLPAETVKAIKHEINVSQMGGVAAE